MQRQIIDFYSSLRQIFLVCPSCDEVHRLSDCKIYQKVKPSIDWKEKIDKEIERLEALEERLQEKIDAAKEAARIAGRKAADKIVKKIDPIFHPLGLNCNDCKVIFHPVDFVVFRGMNNNHGDCLIKELVFLDKNNKAGQGLAIQKSVEKAVQKRNYEWLTLRVSNDGVIVEE
jgi:predicted Holliday junction resolvase-like endonuclease